MDISMSNCIPIDTGTGTLIIEVQYRLLFDSITDIHLGGATGKSYYSISIYF